MSTDLVARIERVLPDYGFHPTAAVAARLGHYLELVGVGNARMRLVGDAAPETLLSRHLGESLYLGQVLQLGGQRVVDLGSGAGFPGLALALGWPELNTTLVESTGKKAEFLRQTIAALEVGERVTVEEVFLERRRRELQLEADLVTVRALEHMEAVPGWLADWLAPGASAAFWITTGMQTIWRHRYKQWEWGDVHIVPNAHSRGIVVGVPRGTR